MEIKDENCKLNLDRENIQLKKKNKKENKRRYNIGWKIFILLLFLAKIIYNNINYLYYKNSLNDYNHISLKENEIQNKTIIKSHIEKETFLKTFGRNSTEFFKTKYIEKFNKFIKICRNGKLIDKTKYPLPKNPKISAIIPLYNAKNFLSYSLRSIQNQNMKDIEIILVNDASTDNTLELIKEFMKEDERIRLINNEKNRQILYSKSIAALNSNGKYIILLDQDDIFIRDDIFDILYYHAENENLDIVQVRDISKTDLIFNNSTRIKGNLISEHNTHIKFQPEIKCTMFTEGNNYLLWGLLIKSDIYKRVIYHMWPLIINYKIIFQEDYTVTFIILILTQKFKYINIFALIHYYHSKNTGKNKGNKFYLSVLFLVNNIYEFYIKNNPQDIEIIFHYMNYFGNYFKETKNKFPVFYKLIMHKLINNEYLTENQKKYLLNNLPGSERKEFKIWNTSEYLNETEDYKEIYYFQYSNFNKEITRYASKPKISIIVICSEHKYLDKTIISIQNQNFTDFEIILVYDNYKENELKIIQNYIRIYPNIKLINNKKRKGFIYSISKGVLACKGKYILILESSYTLAKENSLNYIYNLIISNNIDILEFNILINLKENFNKNSLSIYKCPHFKSQVNLSAIKYNQNYIGIDQQKDLLVNKLIRLELFKSIIKRYKFYEIKRKIFNYYDEIFLFSLKKNNCTFLHLNIFGIIQNINNSNSLNVNNIKKEKNQKIKDSIFYINFLYDFSDNSIESKEFVVNELFNIMNIIYNKFTKITKESYNLYEKFINCKFISKYNKNLLKLYYRSLVN